MWAYLFSVPRTEGATDEVELKRIDREFSKPTLDNHNPEAWTLREPLFAHLGKRRVWVLVKADLTDAQAETLSNNDCLLTGTVKLIWWEPVMGEDFRRTLDENDKEGSDIKVCKIDLGKVGDKEAAVLAMLVKNLPDGPDKAELLATLAGYQANAAMAELEELEENHLASEDVSNETVLTALAALVKKIESVPDGEYRDRLFEILRRDAKKLSASPVADKEAELLAIVIRNLPDGEDKDQLLELLARNASAPGNTDLPDFMVDFEALLVRARALRTVSSPPVVITARDIMMKMGAEVLAGENKETQH